ncbi:MAG: BON domain-containing protein [Planctomycetia bacterium]|nr:BON domain-containing protein [Planctomycetia bacterium]
MNLATNIFAAEPVADHDIARLVRLFLASLQVAELRRLSVEVHDGHVTLSGRVGSFYYRSLAVSSARNVEGVRRVVERITVDRSVPAVNPLEACYLLTTTNVPTGSLASRPLDSNS